MENGKTKFLALLGIGLFSASAGAQTAPAAPAAAAPAATAPATPAAGTDKLSFKFDFGSGKAAPGYTQILPTTVYTTEQGYGFEPSVITANATNKEQFTVDFDPVHRITAVDRGGADELKADFLTSGHPFYFSVKVPEGNYKVTVTLGDPKEAANTTVKAELRRLMVENAATAAGESVTKTFLVNVRRPQIAGGTEVRRKAPRETVSENWAWDDKLTLEFNGPHPAVASVEIEKVEVPQLFIVGDSTSTDQSMEPWNSWGQMFTRFIKPTIVVANNGESGESAASAFSENRLAKVWTVAKPGDFMLVQFGHNDAAASFGASLQRIVDQCKEHGVKLYLVTPVEHRNGLTNNTLGAMPATMREIAAKNEIPLLELHDGSQVLYQHVTPEDLVKGFQDGTHHRGYLSYEVAKLVVSLIQNGKLELAKYIVDDFKFDPAQPDKFADVNIPFSIVMDPAARNVPTNPWEAPLPAPKLIEGTAAPAAAPAAPRGAPAPATPAATPPATAAPVASAPAP